MSSLPESIKNVQSLKNTIQVGFVEALEVIITIYNDKQIVDKEKAITSYLDLFIEYLCVYGISKHDWLYQNIELLTKTLALDGLYKRAGQPANGLFTTTFKEHQERVEAIKAAVRASRVLQSEP